MFKQLDLASARFKKCTKLYSCVIGVAFLTICILGSLPKLRPMLGSLEACVGWIVTGLFLSLTVSRAALRMKADEPQAAIMMVFLIHVGFLLVAWRAYAFLYWELIGYTGLAAVMTALLTQNWESRFLRLFALATFALPTYLIASKNLSTIPIDLSGHGVEALAAIATILFFYAALIGDAKPKAPKK